MAHRTSLFTNSWLKRSCADIRIAFIEDATEHPNASTLTRRETQQSSRDVAELAAISLVLCAAGLAAVWSTTL